jgi:hypothetical protein
VLSQVPINSYPPPPTLPISPPSPYKIEDLAELEVMDFMINQLTTRIPPEIGQLKKLKRILLWDGTKWPPHFIMPQLITFSPECRTIPLLSSYSMVLVPS